MSKAKETNPQISADKNKKESGGGLLGIITRIRSRSRTRSVVPLGALDTNTIDTKADNKQHASRTRSSTYGGAERSTNVSFSLSSDDKIRERTETFFAIMSKETPTKKNAISNLLKETIDLTARRKDDSGNWTTPLFYLIKSSNVDLPEVVAKFIKQFPKQKDAILSQPIDSNGFTMMHHLAESAMKEDDCQLFRTMCNMGVRSGKNVLEHLETLPINEENRKTFEEIISLSKGLTTEMQQALTNAKDGKNGSSYELGDVDNIDLAFKLLIISDHFIKKQQKQKDEGKESSSAAIAALPKTSAAKTTAQTIVVKQKQLE
jgi:hypothetical protein